MPTQIKRRSLTKLLEDILAHIESSGSPDAKLATIKHRIKVALGRSSQEPPNPGESDNGVVILQAPFGPVSLQRWQLREVMELLDGGMKDQGNKIPAIKKFREHTGEGLYHSKLFVDDIVAQRFAASRKK